jgi:hypothetical protein
MGQGIFLATTARETWSKAASPRCCAPITSSKRVTTLSAVHTANFWLLGAHATAVTFSLKAPLKPPSPSSPAPPGRRAVLRCLSCMLPAAALIARQCGVK